MISKTVFGCGVAAGLPRLGLHAVSLVATVAGLCAAALPILGQEPLRPVLDKVAEVRQLSLEEAERRPQVRIQGVVTFFSEQLFSRFVQDDTAGIYFRESANTPPLRPGQQVEITGVASPGEYAPVIEPQQIRVLGEAPLPEARPVTFQQLATGQEDSQFVEISGIVRSIQLHENSGYQMIDLATDGGRLTTYAQVASGPTLETLVDSRIRVRGVCSSVFNRQRQLFNIRLVVPQATDVITEAPAPENPFDMPSRPLGSLLQFAPHGSYGHRIKVKGTLVHQKMGESLHLEENGVGLRVQTRQGTRLQLGDQVEVLGFVSRGHYNPMLEDATFRRVGAGPLPQPKDIGMADLLGGDYDSRLVRIEATLLDTARQTHAQFFVLESEDTIFNAFLEARPAPKDFEWPQKGSKVAVTGICIFDPGDLKTGERWRTKSFQLLLRAPTDVVLLQAPPWWTLQRLLWTVGLLVVVSLLALAWVVVLRGRVQEQTQVIRQQLQVEASLKERYRDLFENANDMVFTHDRSGRLTSINRSGERLLQRARRRLLEMNLQDLVAPDQRPEVEHWLGQLVKGGELPAEEWDFLSASGRRVKMELSGRLIEQPPCPPEVEVIARDITERRRLENELLEISSSEQRRIGHDLHDGVCQHLVGTACLVEILNEKLQEEESPLASVAEKIGGLINEATVQARGVARGLFPVRLEESGLVAAIEELAAGASERFRIECEFNCPLPPSTVDNEVALHLYYIAQESLLNAVKHGKATRVTLNLEPEGERFRLGVRDNGVGFQAARRSQAGMGIRIMRYRAKVIGATLDVISQQGRGTEVTCMFFPTRKPRENAMTTIHGQDLPIR